MPEKIREIIYKLFNTLESLNIKRTTIYIVAGSILTLLIFVLIVMSFSSRKEGKTSAFQLKHSYKQTRKKCRGLLKKSCS